MVDGRGAYGWGLFAIFAFWLGREASPCIKVKHRRMFQMGRLYPSIDSHQSGCLYLFTLYNSGLLRCW
ncbi:hypothetical protein L1987_24254 [Smallanthus sonchifolius]|uniref:Uncharacterized protein n=1 Tax=Smallanthus sonchifolius TaxID=185202 RepID=A0ACB9IJY7_9ASTR|nr:hypothetical protein L1987_24254 [Smallanthus sonchifolius]